MMASKPGNQGPEETKDVLEYCNFKGEALTIAITERSTAMRAAHDIKLWVPGK